MVLLRDGAPLTVNVPGWNAQLLGDDLRVRGLVPLALRLGAEPRHRLARGMDPDLAGVEHLQAEDVELLARPRPDDLGEARDADAHQLADRKSTRLNSSHVEISYAVFCLKKKKQKKN